MTHEQMVRLITACIDKVADFLASQEKELLDFIAVKGKEEQIARLETQIAKMPELQAQLAVLKAEPKVEEV